MVRRVAAPPAQTRAAKRDWNLGVSEQQQADSPWKRFGRGRLARSVERSLRLQDRDKPSLEAKDRSCQLGLVRADLTPRPSYAALKSYLR